MYYKVVSKDLSSCCLNFAFPREYRVQYKINEWVKPSISNTRMFLFKDLTSAENFVDTQYTIGSVRIFSCKAKNVSKVKLLSYPTDIREFWQYKFKHKKLPSRIIIDVPNGTLSASEIMLLEEVC